MLYQVGELILYGSTGVCKVMDVKKLEIEGEERRYYVLKPLYQECTISTPAENGKVFMRPVLTREEAEQLIDRIPSMRADAFETRVLRELVEHYEASLKTHDCADLVELTMSLYAKKQGMEQQKKKFGALDERFMKRAEDLLFGELSVSLGIPKEEVPRYIEARVGMAAGEESGAHAS